MLSLRDSHTHCFTWMLTVLLVWPMLVGWIPAVAAEPARVGTGDLRLGYEEGYQGRDYRSRSGMLGSGLGTRMALHELALNPPLGLPPVSRTLSSAEIDLGRRLFFDRRLSLNATLSCAMCHIPEQGFTQNEMATPVGIEGRSVRRNAPALYNVGYSPVLFHDGRETQLARQIWEPLLAANEMGNVSREQVIVRIAGLDDYHAAFLSVYPSGLTEETLGLALASYQQGLISGASRFDQWYFGADAGDGAFGEAERRGFELFKGKGCVACHTIAADYALFTNHMYYNTGIGYLANTRAAKVLSVQLAPGVFVEPTVAVPVDRLVDDGRSEVTGQASDHWRYRTPSLRNVALTAPYMHDGSLPTLAAVIQYYDGGGAQAPNQNVLVRPLGLSADEKKSLLAFLHALTGSNVDALAADARSVAVGEREAPAQSQ